MIPQPGGSGAFVNPSGSPQPKRYSSWPQISVSTRHALALVNRGGTTAELLAFAEEIEQAVLAKFGVRLEREAVVV